MVESRGPEMRRPETTSNTSSTTWLASIVTAVLCCLAWLPAQAAFSPQLVTFGTKYQERVFVVRDGVFKTLELRDKFPPSRPPVLAVNWAYRTMRVSSTEFGIYPKNGQPLTTYDFIYQSHREEMLPNGGRSLQVELEDKSAPINVTLIYTTDPGKPWMRKIVRITPRILQGRKLFIDRIDVERLGYPQGGATGGGRGQPIFFESRNQFFGLEYPQAHDDFTRTITLTHYPAALVGDGLDSKPAVWGVAPDGQVRREFLEQYVPSFAVHYPSKPFANFDEAFNAGYSTNESIALQSIGILKQHLIKQGVPLDSYSFPHWEDYDSIWRVSPELFPNGFGPVQKAAEAAGTRLGLWLSLTGGILNTYWGINHGIAAARADEVNGPYCIADANYRTALERALRNYVIQNRVNFYWCDFNSFSCPARGYPAGSQEALEAEVDAYIDVLESIHKADPATRIEITTGMWLSPWWLKYADWVWLGGSDIDFMMDSGKPSLLEKPRREPPHATRRYADITYRDYVIWSDLHDLHDTFPFWGLKTHGFYNWDMIGGAPDAQAGVEGDPSCCDEPLNQWSDHVVTSLLRGISDWNLLLNLHWMAADKWKYVVAALKWGRANWNVLSTTQMILGDPSKFEVYGYTHFRNERGLIMVRNPAAKPQTAAVALTPANGFWGMSSQPLKAHEIYPCVDSELGKYAAGDRIKANLAPYEARVIELGDFGQDSSPQLATRACSQ